MRKTIYSLLGILMIVTALQQVGCLDIPNEMIMPQWDVELNVPLIKRTYSLEEIIKSDKQNYINLDPQNDSIYYIQSDKYEIASGISQFITVTNQRASQNNNINASATDSTQIFLAFPEGAQLNEAIFTKGFLAFSAQNKSLIEGMTLTLRVPGIISPAGAQFVATIILPPGGSDSVKYDLSGYRYKEPVNQLFLFKGQIWLIAKAATATNLLASALLNAYSSDFLFSSATGYLPVKSLGVTESTNDLKIGDVVDFRDKAFLREATLNLTANYKSPAANPFEIEVKDLKVTGRRSTGQSITLAFNNSPNLTLRFHNGSFDTSFTQLNSNITEFLTFLPDQISVSAEYIMNPDDDKVYHTATSQDSVKFETSFTSRSFFALRKSTIVDTSEVELNDDNRDRIRDGRAAYLTVEIENGIPLTTWLKADMVDKNYNLLFTVTKNSGKDSLYFLGAEVGANGEVTKKTVTTTTLQLDSAQIQKLADAKYFIHTTSVRTRDAFNNPPPTVALRGNQKLTIRAYGGVTYFIKEEKK